MKVSKIIAIISLITGLGLLILGIILFACGIGRGSFETESFEESFGGEITGLEIRCDVGELMIESSPHAEKVVVKCEDVADDSCEVYQKDGTLFVDYKIEEQNKFVHIEPLHIGSWDSKIVVVVPEKQLENMKVKMGVGEADIVNINVNRCEIKTGIGEFEIKNCNFTEEFKVKNGIGELRILNSNLANLNLDNGIGESNINYCDLSGQCYIKNGIGQIDMELNRSREFYSFDVENGIGSVDIKGDMVTSSEVDGKAIVKLENGIGEINIECA